MHDNVINNPIDFAMPRMYSGSEAAQHHQQRLSRICRLGKLGWWQWNVRGEHIDASGELYEIYGLNKKELPVFSSGIYLAFVHPDDLDLALKHVSIAWQSSSHQYRHRIIKPDGEVVHIELNVETERDDQNNISSIYGTVRDISAQVMAERDLTRAESKFEDIMESIGDGFFAVDKHWTITYWNKKAEAITGLKRQQVLGKHIAAVYPNGETFLKKLEKAFRKQSAIHFEQFSAKYSLFLDVSAYPSQDGLTIYVRDITEKKRLQEEKRRIDDQLKRTSENLINTLECMPDGFCTLDTSWRFTYINNNLATMIGGTKEDFMGKCLWKCFPEAVNTKFYNSYHRALKEQVSLTVEDFYAPLNIWFEVNIHPIKGGLSFFMKDVSERKRQEQRLEFISKATSEVIWEYDLKKDELVFDTKKFEQLFGYILDKPSIPFSYWFNKIPNEDIEAALVNREYAIEHDYNFYVTEYRLTKADGNLAYVKDRVYIVRDKDGNAVSLIGAMEDVTMAKLAEKTLIESIESYRLLFNNGPLPAVVHDPESLRIWDVNAATVEQYGYSREELLSMSVLDLHPPELHQKIKEFKLRLTASASNCMGMGRAYKEGRATNSC